MSPGDVVSINPQAIRFKLSRDLDLGGVKGGDWDVERRVPIEKTDKHRSIFQRYVEGKPWSETDLFLHRYAAQLKAGEPARGSRTLVELLADYEGRVDAMFKSMQEGGFQDRLCGTTNFPKVHIGRDGEVLLGNNGNHRLAMAKVLRLAKIPVRVYTRHAEFDSKGKFQIMDLPVLPDCAQDIPAMTTEAERLAYYRLAKEQAGSGAVIEMGAWLGAATAYIAAGLRDASVASKVHVYDRFEWRPAHAAKGAKSKDMLGDFRANLGPLLDHIELHPGEITKMVWGNEPVSLVVFDAPKRVAAISAALKVLAGKMQQGSVMAWQDFAYFPSYDIPACMIRLGKHVEFVEGIYPGTTAVFRVTSEWKQSEVSPDVLSVKRWKADEIEMEWDRWSVRLPVQQRPRFMCGAAMFLHDIGAVAQAKKRLQVIVEDHFDEVVPKWRYLKEQNMAARYVPLFDTLKKMGAL